jgi:D-alanyl-D-alanine carboxypeptidase
MSQQQASLWRRVAIAGLLASLTIVGSAWDGVEAGAPRRDRQSVRQTPDKHVVHGPNYHPPYSAIVIDDNSGQVLHDENADEPRHPASLTKIMTLYLLFEQLEAGKLKLNTPLQLSAFAALQPPTKLGLKTNQALAVEDAIKGLVTCSANDAAVLVGEAIAGSEAEFAKLMTKKARALGVTNTTYINASGLPADEQITTARDQALLGLAIQERFPSYYHYFSMSVFRHHGREMLNHNALLGQVEGVDGVDRLHRSLRVQPGGFSPPQREAHHRGRGWRNVERHAQRPHARADHQVHAGCGGGTQAVLCPQTGLRARSTAQ